jgi:REP element-mobilizing transposase RayT
MNRGLARRTMFERVDDIRFFMEGLADATERGLIEVHAYCFMTTHYHLLLRSPEGRMAEGMQRLQTAYSKWFNRGRDRDGALVKGRYVSRRIESLAHCHAVIGYIDKNPVAAGIVPSPGDYPRGSARAYASGARFAPLWLRRDWIEAEVRRIHRIDVYDPAAYTAIFWSFPESVGRVIEQRVVRPASAIDPLDDLLAAASGEVAAWMIERARLADGSEPGSPVLDWALVASAVQAREEMLPSLQRQPSTDLARTMRVGIARDLTAERIGCIARYEQVSRTTVSREILLHQALMLGEPAYADHVGRVVHDALAAWRGRPVTGTDRPGKSD